MRDGAENKANGRLQPTFIGGRHRGTRKCMNVHRMCKKRKANGIERRAIWPISARTIQKAYGAGIRISTQRLQQTVHASDARDASKLMHS